MFIICKELIVDDKGHLVKKDCILEFKGFAEDASKLYIISGNERFMIYNEGDIESKIFDNLVSAVLQNKQYIEKNLTVVRMQREGNTYTSVYSVWVDDDKIARYDQLEDLIDKADALSFKSDGCVDCDECDFRSEEALCTLSDNDHDCMLLGFRSKDLEKKKANITTVEYMSMFDK